MKVFVLAAGLGKRLRPLTFTVPKPLVNFRGRPIISYSLENLEGAGVREIGFNFHHLGAQVADYMVHWAKSHPLVTLYPSDERKLLLGTGGALAKAYALFGHPDYFLTMNSDTFWIPDPNPSLYSDLVERMERSFDQEKMDFLLALVDPERMKGYGGEGDFCFSAVGGADLYGPLVYGRSHVFTGVQMVNGYNLLFSSSNRPFSVRRLWDKALARGRLYGLYTSLPFFHVGDTRWLLLHDTHQASPC